MTEPTTETTHPMTPQEMFDDLGGFEEIAIANRFGTSVNVLASTSPTQFIRALIFANLRRDGDSDGDAYKTAQGMKLGEVKTYFREDEAEPGKDE